VYASIIKENLMPKRSKPKEEIVQTEPREAAAGSSDPGGDGSYRQGQIVLCKILNSEPGGYKLDMPGFLPTSARLRPGDDVLAQYVCVHRGRVMVASSFSSTEADNTQNRSWLVQPISVD
jgi:hypothetical protein